MLPDNISQSIYNNYTPTQRFQEKLSLFAYFDDDFKKIQKLKFYALEDKEVLKKIAKLQLMLKQTTKSISFFGVFKAGKSSLLNAIVGEKILPSRTNRATGVITKIGYGLQKQGQVIYNSSSKKTSAYFPLEELDKYILLDVSQATAKAPKGVEAVNVEIPLPLLNHNCYLVDTPGLLDNPTLTECTYEQIENSDLCVVVLAADKLLSEQELIAIAQVNNILNGSVVFLLNRMGVVEAEEKEEIIEWAKSSLSGVGNCFVGRAQIFPTDAMEALSYKTNKGQYNDDVKGLLKFEHWLNLTFSIPMGDRLAMLSRLGIVNNCLNEALGHFQTQLATTQENIEHLEQLARDDLQKRQQLFNTEVDEIKLKILQLKSESHKTGEEYFSKFQRDTKILIDIDECDWIEQVKQKWRNLIQDYLKGIEVKLQEALKKTNITLEPIANSSEINQILDLKIESDLATNIGRTFKNSLFLGGSRWLGKALFGADLVKENLDQTHELARESLNKVFAYIEKFLKNLELSFKKYINDSQPVLIINPALAQARATLVEYKLAQELIKNFKVKVEYIKKQVMSWEKQFNEQWQDFEKKIQGQWEKEKSKKIDKSTNFNKIADNFVYKEIKTWYDKNHYNGIWLENLKKELPKIGEELEAKLKEVGIKEDLKVPAKVKAKELSIFGFGAFSALVVLLWGQNITSINWEKINLKQGLTAVGLLASSSYLFNKTREERLANNYQSLKQQIMNDLNAHGKELLEITKKADHQTL